MFTKKNKVLFIIHDVYQSNNLIPLGPAYLAAVLYDKGADAESYCMDVFHYTNEQLAKHLDDNEYDLICLGFLAARFKETVIELCRVINNHKKNAWLVLGGHGASPIPEYVLRTTKADVVAIGEAENTIIDLLFCKINKGDLVNVKGIAYLNQDVFCYTGRNKIVVKLDELPFPLYDIFPMEKYLTGNKFPGQPLNTKHLGLISGRGCINRCNFCYRIEPGIRLRSIKNVIEEIKALYHKYGVKYYTFRDELFILNQKRLLELEQALKEAKLEIKFDCAVRVDIINEESVAIIKRCGCELISFGLESADDNVLKLMNKNTTVAQNIKALEVVKQAGIIVGLNFLWNNLGDNEETLWKNVKMTKEYNDYWSCRTIKPTTAYPGSDLYYKLIETGKLKGPEDFFNKFRNIDLMLVNLMDMPDKRAYELLLEANTDLTLDHYKHTGGDIDKVKNSIQRLADLYAGKDDKFRGIRHQEHQEEKVEE